MTFAINVTGSSAVGAKRPDHDFRPTPPEPTQALINHYRDVLQGKTFHEASCGDGAICRVLEANDLSFFATDLIGRNSKRDLFDDAYGEPSVDFLKLSATDYPCGRYSTIQNPPFSHWKEFVFKCHELQMPFIAMFAKQQVWNAATRLELWRKHPPKAIHPLTWRVDFDGRGRPTMDCCWCVWGDEVPFSNQPFERPKR